MVSDNYDTDKLGYLTEWGLSRAIEDEAWPFICRELRIRIRQANGFEKTILDIEDVIKRSREF